MGWQPIGQTALVDAMDAAARSNGMTDIKAMILAAGRGERMRPLTDVTPKPLLKVGGKALIDWHVEALALGGFTGLIINTAWLANAVERHFSDHLSRWRSTSGPAALSISYSHEALDFGDALETAGGIARALPLLSDIFWVLAADVYMPGFAFLPADVARFAASDKLAHVWLVPNPVHNLKGDFGLSSDGLALNLAPDATAARYTFSTVGLYRKAFFDSLPTGNPQGLKAPLAPLLRQAMDNQHVSATLYTGAWTDVGTPARLAELNQLSD